ncbi:MAG: hypothetical protein WCP03_04285 [Candidatus Saccharibacteria bacterium]
MKRKLLKDIANLTDSYGKNKPSSLAQKATLKKLHLACKRLITKSNNERELRQCLDIIPSFCHARKIANKKLSRLLKDKEQRSKKIEEFIQNLIRKLFIQKLNA